MRYYVVKDGTVVSASRVRGQWVAFRTPVRGYATPLAPAHARAFAHLDHDHTNNRFSNLAALCQKCHLTHDAKQHQANRKYGRYHNRAHQQKLF